MGEIQKDRPAFVSICKGNLRKLVSEAEAGKDKVIKVNDRFYYEFDALGGFITDAKIVDGYEGAKDCQLTIKDGKETWLLKFQVGSGYFRSFMSTVPNADLSKQVVISAGYKKKEGKKFGVGSVFLNQNDQYLKRAHTMDNPHGMPEASVSKNEKGEPVYNYLEQSKWLWKKFEEQLKKTEHDFPVTETDKGYVTEEDDAPF